jgi:hypothetical protein
LTFPLVNLNPFLSDGAIVAFYGTINAIVLV